MSEYRLNKGEVVEIFVTSVAFRSDTGWKVSDWLKKKFEISWQKDDTGQYLWIYAPGKGYGGMARYPRRIQCSRFGHDYRNLLLDSGVEIDFKFC